MERLTMRKDGVAYWRDERCAGEGYRMVEGKDDQNRLDRLAEYEDTGFTPNDIKDLKNELCLLCGKYKIYYPCPCNYCRWR